MTCYLEAAACQECDALARAQYCITAKGRYSIALLPSPANKVLTPKE